MEKFQIFAEMPRNENRLFDHRFETVQVFYFIFFFLILFFIFLFFLLKSLWL